MALKESIIKILDRKYAPYTLIECTFGRYDLAFRTDCDGKPILLLLGKKTNKGHIKSEPYIRHLVYSASGEILKDQWEKKNKIQIRI